jgi:endonuclease/exonuclease/phosphatase family metal-dependent hydrolase
MSSVPVEPPLSGRLSILSLNLRFGLADDGPNSWVFRQSALDALLSSQTTDFMGFQEANHFQVEFLTDRLPGYDRIGVRWPAPPFWQNNVLFYRRTWRCLHADHFFLSPTPDIPSRARDSRWPRQCTLGMFQREGFRLIVVNTHFDFDARVQAKSAELILKRLAVFAKNIPVIVIGDFNADPQSSCRHIFASASTQPERVPVLCFKDAFVCPQPGTFHGFSGKTDGQHIDWILYRGPLILEQSEVVTDCHNGIYPSDHYPVMATFRPAVP